MKRPARLLLVAAIAGAAVAGAAAGCGGRVPVPAAQDAPAVPAGAAADVTTTAPAGAATAPGGDTSTTAPPAGAAGAAGAADTTPTAPAVMTEVTPGFPFELTLSRTCATRGSTVRVELRTRPHASIAAAAEYADGDAHGALTVGSADTAGGWAWTFVVSPEAPLGDARVMVSAQDRTPSDDDPYAASTNGDTGEAIRPLQVASRCG